MQPIDLDEDIEDAGSVGRPSEQVGAVAQVSPARVLLPARAGVRRFGSVERGERAGSAASRAAAALCRCLSAGRRFTRELPRQPRHALQEATRDVGTAEHAPVAHLVAGLHEVFTHVEDLVARRHGRDREAGAEPTGSLIDDGDAAFWRARRLGSAT